MAAKGKKFKCDFLQNLSSDFRKNFTWKCPPYRSTERHDHPPEIRGGARGPKCGATSPPNKIPIFGFREWELFFTISTARSRLQKLGFNSQLAGGILPQNLTKPPGTLRIFSRDPHVRSGQNSKFAHIRYRIAPKKLLGENWRVLEKLRGQQ